MAEITESLKEEVWDAVMDPSQIDCPSCGDTPGSTCANRYYEDGYCPGRKIAAVLAIIAKL